MADNEVRMMMSVLPGAMTGFAALNSGLVSINNVFGAMTRSIDAQFGLIDAAIMTTGVVVAQLGADAMDAFGQFEQGMKIVQMVSGQTRADIDLLSQKANEFSVQYRVDIDQITEGLQTLGRAGLNSASEQAEVLESGLYTAKLEGRDLNGVLEELIQTTALLGGNLKSDQFGEQSAYVEDLMVATSMTAPITTHDVNETLKYSGGIAAAAGANIESEEGKKILEDYMGSIAAFAQKGVTGSIAGTALRAFFNKPATQDSSVKEALATIHLKPEYLWEDDEQTMKPVSEQIKLIQDQMDDLNISTMDRLQIWSKIVGGKMGQQMMKLDSDDIKNLTKDIQAADSASSLATNSMKTYEANLKAVGESGALLQRNVGEKLVYFANPILEIINKVASFANQDFMSWPLAIGIMSFIGLAGRKAIGVVRAIKAEISTLYSGLQQGINYFTQKQGVVRSGDNPLEDQKERYKAYFRAKDEYYGRTPRYENDKSKEQTTKSAEKQTPQEFQKSLWKQSSQPTVGELRKAGWTDTEIGLTGRMAALKKDSFGIGMSDAQFANFLGKHHILTEAQQAEANKILSTTNSARGPFNQLFMGESGKVRADIADQIRKNEAAMKELGWTIQEETPIVDNNVNAHTAAIKAADKEANQLKALIEQKQSMAQKEVEIENTKNEEILTTVKSGAENVVRTVSEAVISIEEAMGSFVPASKGFINKINSYNKNTMNSLVPVSPIKTPNFTNIGFPVEESFGKNPMMGGGTFGVFDSPSGMNFRDYWFYKGLQYQLNPPKERPVPETPKKPYTPSYPKTNDPQAEYYNKLAEKENLKNLGKNGPSPSSKESLGKYGDVLLSKNEQDEVAKKLGLGKYAEDGPRVTPLEKAQKQAAKNLEEGTSPMSKNGGTMLSMYGAAKRMEQELEENTRTLEEKRTIQDRINVRQASITRGSMSSDISGLGKFGLGKDDVRKIQQESIPSNRRKMFLSRGSLPEETSGNIIGRNEVRSMAARARDAAVNAVKKVTADAIKNNMETNSIHSKLNKQINEMASQNKKLGSTYLQGIKENQQRLAAIVNSGASKQPLSNQYQFFARDLKEGFTGPKHYNIGERGLSIVGPYTPLDTVVGPYTPVDTGKKQGFGSSFARSFSERINRDRMGSFLSFGSELGPNGMRSATKGLSGLANKALNLTDAFGGPLMVAIMAVTTAIQLWQKAFQDYCEDLKEAGQNLQNAYSKRDEAEDSLRRTYKEGNPDATESEIDDMVLETYSTMNQDMQNAWNNGQQEWFKKTTTKGETGEEYVLDEEADDGSTKVKEEEEKDPAVSYEEALKENTGALYGATAELSAQMDNYTRKMNDSWWGLDGWTGKVTNALGSVQDYVEKNGISLGADEKNPFGNRYGSRFSDENEFLLTAQQKDENYSGYTEMAGLMVEDFKDAGISKELSKEHENWVTGMRTMMGEDVDIIKDVMSNSAKKMLNSVSVSMARLTPGANSALQASMKYDNKTWSKLGKEIAKYELKNRKSIGKDASKSTKKIEGLIQKLNTSMGGKLDRTHILQAAYLMEMQEMYEVAQNTMVPLIQQNAETAANQLFQAEGIAQQTEGTGGSTSNTAAIASSIAAMVSVIAMAKSGEAYYNQLNMSNPDDLSEEEKAAYDIAQDSENAQDFIKKAGSAAYKDVGTFTTSLDTTGVVPFYRTEKDKQKEIAKNQAAISGILKNYMATAKMSVYGYDTKTANDAADAYVSQKLKEGVSPDDLYKTIAKNYQSPAFLNKLVASYVANQDEGEGSSGGGSGSGSGNKDKDTGTKKERVDLVLCSKKEIPKLNVNLFKKPPTFTVLNKNFKVRDVKINTEDTPKAIMSAIKNSFIDVQKRSDPKIIQDEEGVYNPEEGTEGNPLPSGTAKTRTD